MMLTPTLPYPKAQSLATSNPSQNHPSMRVESVLSISKEFPSKNEHGIELVYHIYRLV
jgi:hypothetical protein